MSSAGGGEGPTEHTGNTAMFAVFMLAIYSLGLFPYTLYRLCGSGDDAAQPVVAGKNKKVRRGGGSSGGLLARLLNALRDRRTLALLVAWAAWAALLVFAARNAGDLAPFDPFAILGLDPGATDRDVKKAYRKLSLQFHPDKNPDPKAAAYFASHIAKAYAALTDPVSRDNYEKHGHPDGPQGMNVGVALPEWMFTKDRKMAPLMLLALVGGGVLLPMALAAWHLFNGQKYSGPNRIMNETFSYLWHSPFKVKEVQHLGRIPETLICAHEFMIRPFPPSHVQPVEDLRALVAPRFPEMLAKSHKPFWQRKPGLVKAHLLVLAHMEGLGPQVPRELWDDYKYVMSKVPLLAEEIHRIALYPREPLGCGWAAPAVSSVEAMQCMAQCMSMMVRRGAPSVKGSWPGDIAPLVQLPGFSPEAVRLLRRYRPKGAGGGALALAGGASAVIFAAAPGSADGAKAPKPTKREQLAQAAAQQAQAQAQKDLTVRDLQAMDDLSRSEALEAAGLSPEQAEEAAAFLQVLPELAVTVAPPSVDGEEGVCQGDPVRVRARVLLRRPAHEMPGFSLRGRAVRATRQHPPGVDAPPREEGWYALLIFPQANAVLAGGPGPRVNLIEAERAALSKPDAFAAAAAAMARRVSAAPPGIQAVANIIVTPGGPSAVAAAWTAKCERRRKAALEAGGPAGAVTTMERAGSASSGGRPSSGKGGKRPSSAGGGGNGGSAAVTEVDEHAALYEEYGQLLEFQFMSPPEGTYELLLLIMSDAYVGADVAVPVRLTVTRPAQREAAAVAAAAAAGATAAAGAGKADVGKGGKRKGGAAAARADDESELTTAVRGGEEEEDGEGAEGGRGGGGGEDDDDDEDDEDDGGEHSYDSEETGSMETGPESDSGDADGESDGSNSE